MGSNNNRPQPFFRPGAARRDARAQVPAPTGTPIVGQVDELEITIQAKKQPGGGYQCAVRITAGVDTVDALGIMTSVTANMVLEYKNARDALIAANLKAAADGQRTH